MKKENINLSEQIIENSIQEDMSRPKIKISLFNLSENELNEMFPSDFISRSREILDDNIDRANEIITHVEYTKATDAQLRKTIELIKPIKDKFRS